MYEKSSQIYREALGEEHPSVAKALHNMAGVLVEQGKIDEALEKYQKCLRIKVKAHGEVHMSVANTYSNINE